MRGQNDASLDDYNLAIGLYKQKRWSLAADSFRKFVKENPKHEKTANARLYLGLSLVNSEKYADARETLRGFVQEYPGSRNLPDAMYRVGECSYLLDDLKTAESEFRAFLKAYPKHELLEWALPYLADAQLRMNEPEAAAANFKRSLDEFPKGRLVDDSKFGLARAYELLNKKTAAVELYKELAAEPNGPRAPHAQLKLATRAFDDKDFAAAADAYTTLATKFPGSPLVPVAQLNAGYAWFQLGDFQKAVAQFDLAAHDRSQSQTANYWKGVSLKSLGQLEQAAAVLKSTYEADPKSETASKALYQWADSELRRAHHAEAAKLFVQLADRWPKSELADDSLHFAAESALLAGDLDQAQKLLDRFDGDFPQSALRKYHEILKGRLLAARGGDENRKQAVARFQKVIDESQLDRTRSLARFHLARTLQMQGKDSQAVEAIRPLLGDLKKGGPKSEFVDAWLMAGNSYAALNQFDEAVAALSTYLEAHPQGPEAAQALATRALAQVQLGHKAETLADLNSLATKFPNDPLGTKTAYRAAEIAYDKSDWDLSGELFGMVTKAGADAPHRAAALSGLGWSQFQAGKYRESAATFAEVLKQYPDDAALAPEASYKHAESLQKANAIPDAAAAYQSAFDKFASAEPAKKGVELQGQGYYAYLAGLQAARLLKTLGETDKSDAAYQKLLERFPEPAEKDKLLDEWALLNYEAKRFERSDEIFRRLVQETPDSERADDARLSLAESRFIAGKLDEAKKAFGELEASAKSDASVKEIALKHLVSIATEQRNWAEVEADAQRFLAANPNSKFRWDVQFRLGEARVQSGKLDAAKATLSEVKAHTSEPAVSQAEWSPRVWILLAEIALRKKNYDEVAALLDELKKEKPKSPLLYQGDEILGQSYKNQAKFDESRAAFTRVVEDEHGRRTETAAKSQLMLAETYLFQKQYQDAQREYLKVYVLYKFPEYQSAALLQAAACDEALNQWQNAVKTYEDLLREFPQSPSAAKAKAQLPIARRKAAG